MKLFLLALFPLAAAYNFLVFNPNFAHSHTNFLSKIADTLTDAGHNVTILMPVADREQAHTGAESTKDIIQIAASDEVYAALVRMIQRFLVNVWEIRADATAIINAAPEMSELMRLMCRATLARGDILEQLKGRHFDVGITEPLSVCGLGIFKGLGIPASIAATSTPPLEHMNQAMGQPTLPSFVPAALASSGDDMSMWERFENAVTAYQSEKTFSSVVQAEYPEIVGKFGRDIGTLRDLMSGVSFQFINTNPYLDFPFPTVQKNIPIGGVQVNIVNKETVNEKWDSILNERPRSILISFGSIARSNDMPVSYRNSLLDVFSSMPNTTFIWKYEDEDSQIVSHLKNVHLVAWVPQKALLGDSRLSLFISHGGLGSTNEIAHLGKPAIMIPLFADQARNSAMLCRHGGAILIEKFHLGDPDKLKHAIDQAMNNASISAAALRLSEMLRLQPFTASQLVVRHAEFAARFGALPQLDPRGRHLSFLQYFLLDIVIVIVAIMLSGLYIVQFVIRRICSSSKPKTD